MGIVGHWTVVRMGIAQDCLRRQGAWWEGDDCTEQTKRLLGRLDARLLWIREAVYSSCAECAASCRQPRRSACDSGLRIGHWTVDSRLGLRLPAQDRALLDSSEGCAFGGKEARDSRRGVAPLALFALLVPSRQPPGRSAAACPRRRWSNLGCIGIRWVVLRSWWSMGPSRTTRRARTPGSASTRPCPAS